MNRAKKKKETHVIAEERIEILFKLAEKAAITGDYTQAKYYLDVMWAIKTKFKISITKAQKVLFCRKCKNFMMSGKTARIRCEDGYQVVECLLCGEIRRYPLLKK